MILRLRGTNDFGMLLLPYRKGQRHEIDVKMDGSKIVIARNGSTTTLDGDCYSYTSANMTILTANGTQSCAASGISIQEGPTEVVMGPNRVATTVHGSPGVRSFRVPGFWRATIPIEHRNNQWLLNYAGTDPVTAVLERAR